MPIHVDVLKKAAAKARGLPEWLVEELMNNYSNYPDLDQRLWKLPVVQKGRQHGSYPRTNVSRYATQKARELDLHLYCGYFIYKHPQTGQWRMHEHVFNVDPKNGRVQEHSRDMDWSGICYYVGMRVPEKDYDKERFVEKFSQTSYILEHSPRALYPVPRTVKEEDTE